MNLPVGMQTVNFESCTGLTGTAELVGERCSYLFNTFWRPAAARPSFLIFSFSFSFHSPFLAGDIGQMNPPVGMQTVNFSCCNNITGTAELGMSEVHTLFNRFRGQPHALLHSSLSPSPRFLPFSYLVTLRSFSQLTLRSGIFPWA